MSARSKMTTSAVSVAFCGMTDIGRIRKNNEDNYAVSDLTGTGVRQASSGQIRTLGSRGALLLVADGMGGEACGEVASATCSEVLPKRFHEILDPLSQVDATAFVRALKQAIAFTNQVILDMAREDPRYGGMGTTVTAAGLLGTSIFVGQVGDSRAYLIRNGKAVQLTRDQTLLNYLADLGAAMPLDLESDNRRNILTQAVGAADSLDIKVTHSELRRGDRLLLCSDGLYNMVKKPEMENLLSGTRPLKRYCQALVEAANANGGTDNITVILAHLKGSGLPEPDAEVAIHELSGSDP
jgi:PPM family protein phosphatase